MQRFQLLFETPRAVKRLANTYSLIRVGVAKDEWANYLGSKRRTGKLSRTVTSARCGLGLSVARAPVAALAK